MSEDDIIRMAREAKWGISKGRWLIPTEELERFAALAYAAGAAAGATAEREKWIKALDAEMVSCHLGVFNSGDDPRAALAKLLAWHQDVALDPAVSSGAQNLILKEREACVEACQNCVMYGPVIEAQQRYNQAYWHCVEAIRARGKNER